MAMAIHLRNAGFSIFIAALLANSSWALDNVVFTNANQPNKLVFGGSSFSVPMPLGRTTAIPFTTNDVDTEFEKVKLYISGASASSVFSAEIYDANMNAWPYPRPKSSLYRLNGPRNLPQLAGLVEFTSSTVTPLIPISLSPKTTYFFVFHDNLSGTKTTTQTRLGLANDLGSGKYALGVPGSPPYYSCTYSNFAWTCDPSRFDVAAKPKGILPFMEIVASQAAPPSYSPSSARFG